MFGFGVRELAALAPIGLMTVVVPLLVVSVVYPIVRRWDRR